MSERVSVVYWTGQAAGLTHDDRTRSILDSEALTVTAHTLEAELTSVVIMEEESPARSINGLQDAEIPKRSDIKVYKEFCDFYVRLSVCCTNIATSSSWVHMSIQLQYLLCY